jgi:hypothetical protein
MIMKWTKEKKEVLFKFAKVHVPVEQIANFFSISVDSLTENETSNSILKKARAYSIATAHQWAYDTAFVDDGGDKQIASLFLKCIADWKDVNGHVNADNETVSKVELVLQQASDEIVKLYDEAKNSDN